VPVMRYSAPECQSSKAVQRSLLALPTPCRNCPRRTTTSLVPNPFSARHGDPYLTVHFPEDGMLAVLGAIADQIPGLASIK